MQEAAFIKIIFFVMQKPTSVTLHADSNGWNALYILKYYRVIS